MRRSVSLPLPLFFCLIISACTDSPPATTLPEAAEYVGRSGCVECHAAQVKLWQDSHHDLAMQEVSPETVLGDFDDAIFSYHGTTSTFFRKDDEFWVRTDGPDGELQDYRIAYTFGVHPLQQYLIEFPNGKLQALGIAWDTRPNEESGQHWFHLYPEENITHEDSLHWTGPNQNWNYMCAECHSTHLQKGYVPGEDRYETTWSEINVSCEACHGPVSGHVTWAEAAARGGYVEEPEAKGLTVSFADSQAGSWVFDPGATTARRSQVRHTYSEIETCAPCHSRRSVLRENRRHGRPLMDSHQPVLLHDPLYFPDGQIRDEVYVYGSFLQSKMYQAGVTCADCHDPHSLQVYVSGNSLCTRCHMADRYDSREHHFHEPETVGSQCVECHMTARDYMVVDSRRDHSLRVPRPDLSLKLGTPNACTGCHTDQTSRWAADKVEEWYGSKGTAALHYGEILHAGQNGLSGGPEALVKMAVNPARPAIVRASALALLERYPGALARLRIGQLLQDVDPMVRHAALRNVASLEPRVRLGSVFPLLSDQVLAVRIEAARVLAGTPGDLMTNAQVSRLRQVLEEYRQAQLTSAERPESHMNLGNLNLRMGEFSGSEREFRTALHLDPGFVPAYINLADQYRAQGKDSEGEEILRQGLSRTDHVAIYHSLGLLLVRRQRHAEAIRHLEIAARRRPEVARYSYVYGVALQSVGRGEEGMDVLKRAQERHPYDSEILSALVSYLAQRGDRIGALGYARKLAEVSPGNLRLREMIRDLESER